VAKKGRPKKKAIEEVKEDLTDKVIELETTTMTEEEIIAQEEKRKEALSQYHEKEELKKQGLEWPLPKLYKVELIVDKNTRQRSHKLTWNLTGRQETLVVRQKKMARSMFLTAIQVLRSLGYKEDLKSKEELSATGWYFDVSKKA